MPLTNLQHLCATKAYELYEALNADGGKKYKDAETHVRNSLGILQEQGLYAFYLYQCYRADKPDKPGSGGSPVMKEVGRLLHKPDVAAALGLGAGQQDLRERITSLLGLDLGRIFLAQEILDRMLTYTLYHLRARGDGPAASGEAAPASAAPAPAQG